MLRGLFAGTVLALSVSAALTIPAAATPVNVISACSDLEGGCNYDFVTSSKAPQAYGTTVTPPAGGLGPVGGLCAPGVGSCLMLGSSAFPTGELASYHGAEAIVLDIPADLFPGGASHYLLSLQVSDDVFHTFAPGSTPSAPKSGNEYQVLLNGVSLGTTSGVPLNGGTTSSGDFSAIVGVGVNYLGITDLLQPYADGLVDGLPGAGTPPGTVYATTWSADIVALNLSLTPAPEPASLLLLGSAVLALSFVSRRTRQLPQSVET